MLTRQEKKALKLAASYVADSSWLSCLYLADACCRTEVDHSLVDRYANFFGFHSGDSAGFYTEFLLTPVEVQTCRVLMLLTFAEIG